MTHTTVLAILMIVLVLTRVATLPSADVTNQCLTVLKLTLVKTFDTHSACAHGMNIYSRPWCQRGITVWVQWVAIALCRCQACCK
jgi:hypothetical protein